VSLSPSTTEAVFAVGAGDRLVGRSRFCDYPADALRLPAVGGYADPSIEAIVALRPTLVIGAHGPAGPALEQTLNAHAIETYFPETESIAQIEGMIVGVGARTHREGAAASVVSRIREQVAAIGRALVGLDGVSCAFVFDVAPIVLAGPGSFPNELIERAGGRNVAERGGAYPTYGIEQLVALDPHVILDGVAEAHGAAGGIAALRDAPGWRELSAVRLGRVRAIDATALRPGPRIGVGLAAIAEALHDGLGVPRPAEPVSL
jgi:iron complex transport system substrate-binding protein